MMDVHRTVAAFAIAALVASSTGLIWVASGPGSSLGAASEPGTSVPSGRFTSSSGSETLRFNDTAWIDVAFRADTGDDLHLEISTTWHRPPRTQPEDRSQVWDCSYLGPALTRDGVDGTNLWNTDLSWRTGCTWSTYQYYDGVRETWIEAAGEEQKVGVDHPWCRVMTECFARMDSGGRLTVDGDDIARWSLPDDGVLHVLVGSGGRGPVNATVDVTWENTAIAVANGSLDDTFTYYREDFDNEVFVGAEVLGNYDPYLQKDGSLTVDKTDGSRPSMFWYLPRSRDDLPANGEQWEHGWIRPDGSSATPETFMSADLSARAGPWRFWVDGSGFLGPGYLVSDDDAADRPVLYGTAFDWAELA